MNTVAIVSSVGGAGRTTLVAVLAELLTQRGHTVVALECDSQNHLGLHLGLGTSTIDGFGMIAAQDGEPWEQLSGVGYRSDHGTMFIPYGVATADEEIRAKVRMLADPGWLGRGLDMLDLAHDAIVLIDTPRWPSIQCEHAMMNADFVLGVVVPDMPTCTTLHGLRAAMEAVGRPSAFVANRVHSGRGLHADILSMLDAELGSALLSYRIHLDEELPESMARGEVFHLAAPHSQAAHDLQGVASWLSDWFSRRQIDALMLAKAGRA